jgi:hypothetical protein
VEKGRGKKRSGEKGKKNAAQRRDIERNQRRRGTWQR